MNRKERDAIINRLLFGTMFSIFASIILWFIYNGYMHTGYILTMPKIMLGICAISLIITVLLYMKARTEKSLFQKFLPYMIVTTIFGLASIAIYFYVLYAIYALWALIALYLVVTFIYNLYKLSKG